MGEGWVWRKKGMLFLLIDKKMIKACLVFVINLISLYMLPLGVQKLKLSYESSIHMSWNNVLEIPEVDYLPSHMPPTTTI